MDGAARQPFGFPKRLRLLRSREFRAVYDARVSVRVGPLAVHARPGADERRRLGLSVSRRVGGAVRRNRIKRLLREAFRLDQASLPAGYDLVITVQPHEPQTLDAYRALLTRAAEKLDRQWTASGETKRPPHTRRRDA